MNSRRDVVTNVRGKAASKAAINRPNGKVKYQSGNRNKVLAERNQAVVPVGAWVECEHDCMEHPAVLASLTEELHDEMRREKEESLLRFQEEVRRRVAQQAHVRKRRQLQKSCHMVESQRGILQQHHGDPPQRYSPGKEQSHSRPQGELDICGPSGHWVVAQALERGDGEHGREDPPAQQRSKTMRQVRHRLAACQTLSDGEVVSELPGGLWNISPTRDKPVYHRPTAAEEEEEGDEEDDSPIIRQHICPLVQQNVHPYPGHKSVTFDSPVLEEPRPTGRVGDRATQVLWPLDEQEQLKRQRQSQFMLYRRLFMDIEREQVQEHKRHRRHLQRITRIKKEKEQMRLEEERKMEARLEMEERELLILERLRLEEEEERSAEWEERKLKTKEKETTRFIEALRARMKERIAQEKLDLPPLCCCGDGFWDAHPDTCANNCTFYNNPRAYVQALQSALSSFDLEGGGVLHRASARKMASMRSLAPRK